MILKFETTFKAKESADKITIRGMASTNSIDRVGDVILAEAWSKGGLLNYRKNPILLFNHNYNEPVGKVVEINVLDNGLEIVGEISKAAGKLYELIKDGVLSTFSVGFGIKNADYLEETGGLIIKDAELYEVSVVSVPCNQDATFSIAKSFESNDEYRDFIKQFTAGQSNPLDKTKVLGTDKQTPAGVKSEINMDPKELEALMQKTAAEAAAKATADAEAKYQAEKEAAAKAAAEAAEKAAIDEKLKETVTIVETGAEKLTADLEAKMKAKEAEWGDLFKQYQADLEAHKDEITKMRESKRYFPEDGKTELSTFAKDFLSANLLGVITGKGYDTDFARGIAEKAGVDYVTDAGSVDQFVRTQIEKEIRLNLRLATAFRELDVISGATVLPIQTESEKAVWQPLGAPNGNLTNRGDNDATFKLKEKILHAYRLISSTYIDNNVDEQVLVNMMPMMVDAVAHAHARAIDHALINGTNNIDGLITYGATTGAPTLDISDGDNLTSEALLGARSLMGKYGMSPEDLIYVVSMSGYYQLMQDPEFQNLNEVGSLATKVAGTVGGVFGSAVVVSDNFPDVAASAPAAFAVNTRNYVIPRLRNVKVERDYEVANQRSVVVASQSLGFEELVDGAAGNEPAVAINYVA